MAGMLSLAAFGLIAMAYGVSAIGARAAAEGDEARRQIAVLYQLERLQTATVNASAQIRGYFLTGDEGFGAAVREAVGTFDDSLKTLHTLLSGSPDGLTEVRAIGRLEGSREERIYGTMARFRSHAISPGELHTVIRAAEQERLSIEARLRQMQGEQNRLAGLHRDAGKRWSLAAIVMAWGGALALAGLVAAVWKLFDGRAMAGIGQLREQAGRLAAVTGRNAAAADRSSDTNEFERLAEIVAAAAELLNEQIRVLDHAAHGIAEIDAAGHFAWHNRAFGEMVEPGDGHGPRQLLACIHGDDWEAVEAAREAAGKGAREETAARLVRADGSTTDVAISFVKAGDETGRSQYVVIRDDRRQRQKEAALISARNAAVEANAAKTRFLAKVTHDIRTPLNAILGASALLSETSLNPEQFEYVSMFLRNSERLVELINDFLDFAKIEAGAVRVERVSFRVRQVVGDAVKTFRESAVRKGLALDMTIAPEVPEWQMGDPLRVQQVLINLVSNAVKFTSAGRIDVRALVRQDENGGRLHFEVADTGAGIKAADRKKLFTPFTQLPHTGSLGTTGGSGLGLAICRELTQLMDGEIGLEPATGPGSTFYFTLPLSESEPVAQTPAGAVTPEHLECPPGTRIRILAAEDAQDSRFLLDRYLRNERVALRMVNDGCEAVEAVEAGEDFDLIFMDIDMPRMDGRTAARRIHEWQARAGASPTAIVALSAFSVQTEVRASLDAGCVDHMVKPVGRAALIGAIRRFARYPANGGDGCASGSLDQGVAELVPGYLAAQTRRIDDATHQLAARDFASIQRFGHNLKGTGSGYGFPEIEKLGSAIETAAAKADEQSVAEQLLALHRVVTEAAGSVRQLQ